MIGVVLDVVRDGMDVLWDGMDVLWNLGRVGVRVLVVLALRGVVVVVLTLGGVVVVVLNVGGGIVVVVLDVGGGVVVVVLVVEGSGDVDSVLTEGLWDVEVVLTVVVVGDGQMVPLINSGEGLSEGNPLRLMQFPWIWFFRLTTSNLGNCCVHSKLKVHNNKKH